MKMSDDPIKISYSQLNSWNRCQFQWQLGRKWQPKVKKNTLAIGTIVHELLQVHYENRHTDTIPLVNEKLQGMLRTAKPDMYGDDVENFSLAGKLVHRYIRDFAKYEDDFDVLETEYYFEVPLVSPAGRDYVLTGYVDKIVESRGKIWQWEDKTIGQGQFWKDDQLMMDAQQTTYMAALQKEGKYDVFGIFFNQLNTYNYKDYDGTPNDKLFRRAKVHRTPAELDRMLTEFGLAVDEMVEGQAKRIRKNINRDCSYCFYQDPCLMDTKGINIEPVLQSNFVRRESGPKKESEKSSD